MTDLAKRFKKTTIPAMTIEGFDRPGPIALSDLGDAGVVEDILFGLSALLSDVGPEPEPDDDNWDNFDWEAYDKATEEKHVELTPQILAIIWEHLTDEMKEASEWDVDYEDKELSDEMKKFFEAREKRRIAEEEAWELESQKALEAAGIA